MVSQRFRTWVLGSLFLVLGALLTLVFLQQTKAQDTCVFSDVCDTTSPYYEAIVSMKEQGFLKGNPDGTFKPDATVNRAEMMTIAFRGSDVTPSYDANYSFPDMNNSEWFAPYVSKAKKEGFVGGYPDGTFRAGNAVTTEEAAKILINFYAIPTPDVRDGYESYQLNSGYAFPYGVDANAWYAPFIKTVYDYRLLDNIPLGEGLTRKEVALLLYRLLETKDVVNEPLKVVTTWSAPGAHIRSGSPFYVYFNKPVRLDTVRGFISVMNAQGEEIPFSTNAFTWSYSNMKLGLQDYPYRPHELAIMFDPGQTLPTDVTIYLHEGLEDIYGNMLREDIDFTATYVSPEETPRLALGGPSYFLEGDTMYATVEATSITQAEVLLCKMNTESYLKNIRSENMYSGSIDAGREYFYISSLKDLDQELRSKCQEVKRQRLSSDELVKEGKNVDLNQLWGSPMDEGIYYIAVLSPESQSIFYGDPFKYQTHRFLYVTNTALTYKRTAHNDVIIWAADTKNGSSRSGITLDMYKVQEGDIDWETRIPSENEMTKIQSVRTDGKGMASFSDIEQDYSTEYLVISKGNGVFGVVGSSWDNGLEPYQYGLSANYYYWGGQPSEYQAHMYTDRKIYRPEHTVHLKGILRKIVESGYVLPTISQVDVSIEDAEDNEVFRKTVNLNEYGTFEEEFVLDEAASLGTYTVFLHDVNPVEDGGFGQNTIRTAYFRVEEYRKPEFRITVDHLQKDYLTNETVDVTVDGEYYFGAKVAGGYVQWELYRDTLFFQPVKNEWFSFANSIYCYYYCDDATGYVSSGSGTLDANGQLQLHIPVSLHDMTSGGLYSLELTVGDTNNREVSKIENFRVHKGELYAGLRTLNYFARPGQELPYSVITLNKDGSIAPNQTVKVEFFKQEWTTYQKRNLSRDGVEVNDYQDTLVETKTVTTGSDGRGKVTFKASTPGTHYALSTMVDAMGNMTQSREYSYVYSDGDGYVSWPSDDSYKVGVLLDQPEYKPGDTARLIVQSPFERATALVSMERDGVMDSYVVSLPTNSTPIDIPVKDAYIPNVFVSVTLLSATGTPGFRQGYGQMMVSTESKELFIELETNKQTFQPRDTVEVTVTTKDHTGRAVPAEVSLAVVDESVIALAGGIDRDVMKTFYALQSLGVFMSHSFTHLLDAAILQTVGGGGKGGNSGLPFRRGNMKDTAFWAGQVQTGPNGKTTVTFELPDNLTRWELLALGTTKDTKVGSMATEIDTRLDFIAQPVLPRFVRSRDQAHMIFSLFNMSDHDESVQATLAMGNVSITEPVQRVTVPAGGHSNVEWAVKIPDGISTTKVVFTALGENLSDSIEMELPVENFQVPDIASVSGQGQSVINTRIAVPDGVEIIPDAGKVELHVNAGLIGSLKSSLIYLMKFPYGCAEQTTSSMIPNILLKDFLSLSEMELPGVTDAQLEKNINAALQKLYDYQSDSGGWSLWGGNNYVEDYLTSYVLFGMMMAQKAGYNVDTDVLLKGRGYLESRVNDGNVEDVNERIYMLYVLQNLGSQVVSAHLEAKYTELVNSEEYRSLAYMLMTYQKLVEVTVGQTQRLYESRIDALRIKLTEALRQDGGRQFIPQESTYYSWGFYGNEIQTNAVVLQALASIDPTTSEQEGIVRYLLESRSESRWASTHETAKALLGINQYLKANPGVKDPVNVEVTINGHISKNLRFAEGAFSDQQVVVVPLKDLGERYADIELNTSGGKVYYDALLEYIRPSMRQQYYNGEFDVVRTVKRVEGERTFPLSGPLKVGDKVEIEIHFKQFSKRPARRVAIEDHLPAGLEALNTRLNTVSNDRGNYSEYRFDHVELRDDRVFLYLDRGRDVTFTYQAQVIAPGTFSHPSVHTYEMYNPAKYSKSRSSVLVIE